MNEIRNHDQRHAMACRHARRARLETLLFSGAALGTAALVDPEVKLPPFHGE